MKCFYHSADLDGHCSGAIVKACFPTCEMIGINYDDPVPWDRIAPGEPVVIVDFCFQPFEHMERLNVLAQITWIDHHKTSVELAQSRGFLTTGPQILDVTRAACELVHAYYHPKRMLPQSVYLLGVYDSWRHEALREDRALPFQYGMRFEENTRPDNQDFWRDILNDQRTKEILDRGRMLYTYEMRQNAKYAQSCAFPVLLDGYKGIAINKGMTSSQLFQTVYDPNEHDIMVSFVRRNGRWTISVYATKSEVDASAICKARGGGGHKGAAGFSCDVLPF